MNITLNKPAPHGTIRAIPSKSYAHRILICAALCESGKTVLDCPALSRDITSTADCLRAMGSRIERVGTKFIIYPTALEKKECSLPCSESGSTLRFLIPAAAALGADADFIPEGRLASRPLSPLDSELERHGAKVTNYGEKISVRGKLTGNRFEIDGSVSSQFITGLLLAIPLISPNGGTLTVTGKTESKPYIDITTEIMRRFGITIVEADGVYTVSGKYTAPGEIAAEGDWSNAAFMLCAGALSDGGITVDGLEPESRQGDRAVFSILKSFGASCSSSGSSFTVKPGKLHGITIDAGDIPDLVPVLSVAAAGADGVTYIRNCRRLRLKESDRIAAIHDMLTSLGGDVSIDGDDIIIRGHGKLRGGTVNSYNDHRIVMSAAVASIICEEEVSIIGCEAAAKSYPGFFDDFALLNNEKIRSKT